MFRNRKTFSKTKTLTVYFWIFGLTSTSQVVDGKERTVANQLSSAAAAVFGIDASVVDIFFVL